MAKNIYYDDNLFFLAEQIKTLRKALELDIDTDLFWESMIQQIFSIDEKCEKIFHSLRNNTQLIERQEHLRNLLRCKRALEDLLEALLRQKHAFRAEVENYRRKITDLKESLGGDIFEIASLLEKSIRGDSSDQVMISEEEFQFLLEESNSRQNV